MRRALLCLLALTATVCSSAQRITPERTDLAGRVAETIRTHGIGQLREGEDVSRFLARIRQ